MKIQLGYACLSKTITETTSSPLTYTEFLKNKDFDKLNKVIISNLTALNKLIDYNIKNNIHFFRLSSKIIPLATKEDVKFDYITPYKSYYEEIGTKIKNNNMRIDFHPDQFAVLNSTKKEVVNNTIEILKYHYKLLNALKIKNKIMVLHIGSSTFGKENSKSRFINNFKRLPKKIQECIAIENDDKIFNLQDCLDIYNKINTPIVFDAHHHKCNPSNVSLDDIFKTWPNTPKMHYSSPKNKTKKDFRSHHEYINCDEFIELIETIKSYQKDIDIMIEAKGKDEALFKLIRELKYKKNYKFIDETSFIV